MKSTVILITFALGAFLGGCVSHAWDGKLQMWGTLRGVLHDGDTSGKVRLDEIVGAHRVGIGAPEGLAGEIIVFDGKAWVSQADDQGVTQTVHPAAPQTEATFLAIASVPRWVNHGTNNLRSLAELEQFVRAAAAQNGLNQGAPFPFLVEGRFSSIKLHVLNGRCPLAQPRIENDSAHDPIRIETNDVDGILVGFYSDGPPGTITHAGTHVHVHALLRDERHTVGHVDVVSIKAGAVIRLPVIH